MVIVSFLYYYIFFRTKDLLFHLRSIKIIVVTNLYGLQLLAKYVPVVLLGLSNPN